MSHLTIVLRRASLGLFLIPCSLFLATQSVAQSAQDFYKLGLYHMYNAGSWDNKPAGYISPEAFENLEKAAAQGHAYAQMEMAVALKGGYGEGGGAVEYDPEKAQRYMAAALPRVTRDAYKGDLEAQNALGRYYALDPDRRDYPLAIAWYTAAAGAGYDEAQYNLGMLHAKGYWAGDTEVAPDLVLAVQWLTRAADQHHARAEYALGKCLYDGAGVPRDPARAVELFTRSAGAGYYHAKAWLGICLYKGDGIARDDARAFRLLTEAAAADDFDALEYLAYCYWYGRGTAVDKAKAEELITQAAYSEGSDPDIDEWLSRLK